MAYGKKTYRKKRTHASSSTAQKANRALSLARSLSSKMNVEFKEKEMYGSATPANTGTLILINGLNKGTGQVNRIGRSVLMKSIQVCIDAVANSSSTTTAVRALLVLDKAPNGITTAASEILDADTATNYLYAFRNLNYRKRFKIIRDWRVSLGSQTSERKFIVKNGYFKMNQHAIYDASDVGTIADISSNALYLLLIADYTSTNYPTVTYSTRLRFVDN